MPAPRVSRSGRRGRSQRLADDVQRMALYAVLASVAGLLLWLTPGLTTCRVL